MYILKTEKIKEIDNTKGPAILLSDFKVEECISSL